MLTSNDIDQDNTMMETFKYRARFMTPAFLGNAAQCGQWRTPPFKALLRQWWRVVWASGNGFPLDSGEMRHAEGLLFGNAWPDHGSRKSAVRIRLSRWDLGKKSVLQGGRSASGRGPGSANRQGDDLLFLGYGPLSSASGKSRQAIDARETADLSIAAPKGAMNEIRSALALIDAYGAVGGRSRNGWGSLSLQPLGGSPAHVTDLLRWSRPLAKALELDWPHAIGKDDTDLLVWKTHRVYDDWGDLMCDLAKIRTGLVGMFGAINNPERSEPAERHWLSYPVTEREVRSWGSEYRLPNSLRFKVRPDPMVPGGLRGVVFHMPCLPPPQFGPRKEVITQVWRKSHKLLDELVRPRGLRQYRMVTEEKRAKLKSELRNIVLQRISA